MKSFAKYHGTSFDSQEVLSFFSKELKKTLSCIISKDKSPEIMSQKEIETIELKIDKTKSAKEVLSVILRYIGDVQEEMANIAAYKKFIQ